MATDGYDIGTKVEWDWGNGTATGKVDSVLCPPTPPLHPSINIPQRTCLPHPLRNSLH